MRSTAIASPTITIKVAIMANQAGNSGRTLSNENGIVPVIRPTSVRAANKANTPWAKLNTPEALKISTNPRATNEYITPDINPPKTTSRKKAGYSNISNIGPTKTRFINSIEPSLY